MRLEGERQLRDDLLDPFRPRVANGLRDPWSGWRGDDGLIDPFAEPPFELSPSTDSRQQLRDYGMALAAYRRALTQQVEDVSARYERGMAFALAGDLREAARTWNLVRMGDPRVEAARRSLERVRSFIARR
jgi:hypothetical protein